MTASTLIPRQIWGSLVLSSAIATSSIAPTTLAAQTVNQSNRLNTTLTTASWKLLLSGGNWQNSLGMKFVRVPKTDVLFCVWLTRVTDYEAYANANAGVNESWKKRTETYDLPISESPTHPVHRVSWEDAQGFCRWLSQKEQEANVISRDLYYRLPTDAEWSKAIGLTDEKGDTPQERHENMKPIFPWGTQWPPPAGAGNFADETLGHQSRKTAQEQPYIKGYNDGFATTSPVGSFPPNKHGLYDLSGNLLEWCEDEYSPTGGLPDHLQGARPMRGGAWTSHFAQTLMSGHRHYENPKLRYDYYGFRVVLAKQQQETRP
jgi:formylglycine-generating enzyme required for sulfatase activity